MRSDEKGENGCMETVVSGTDTGATPTRSGYKRQRHRFDRRCRLGRRIVELVRTYTDALGGAKAIPSHLKAEVEAAAELTATAEQERARYAKGQPVSLEDIVRVENAAARARQRLGLDTLTSKPQAPLRERLTR